MLEELQRELVHRGVVFEMAINGLKPNASKNELDIGVEYKKLGYYTVIIEKPAVIDIGDDHHVSDPRHMRAHHGMDRVSATLKGL